MGRLDGKVVWITGAASGLGRASALACAAEGATVLVTDLEAPAAVVTEIEGLGGQATAMAQDVTDEARWDAIADEAETRFGGFQVLVNNAGVSGEARPLEKQSVKGWHWTVDVNLLGLVYGAKTILPLITAHGDGGWIVNVASMAGLVSLPLAGPYSATKYAVVAMSESWVSGCTPWR